MQFWQVMLVVIATILIGISIYASNHVGDRGFKWCMAVAFLSFCYILYFIFECSYNKASVTQSELAAKINNAYQSGYEITLDGNSITTIPDSILEKYGMYEFEFDDLNATVIITKKTPVYREYNGRLVPYYPGYGYDFDSLVQFP